MAILKDKTGRLNVFISISEIASDFMKLSGSLKARWPSLDARLLADEMAPAAANLLNLQATKKLRKVWALPLQKMIQGTVSDA